MEKEELLNLILGIPALALRYLPNRIEQGQERRARIDRVRNAYNREFLKLYGKIQFIGMSVYKEEATSGVEMERIYIPLRLVPEGTAPADDVIRTDPLTLLGPGGRHVILGDPGCGKSTLLRFLALVGFHPPLRQRFHIEGDGRLPLYVVLRHFADELKERPQLEIGDYLIETAQGFLGVAGFDREFLDYYLEMGEAILLFDGIDELPDPGFKRLVRDKIQSLLRRYPGNTTLVSSRLIGYEKESRYERLGFSHQQVARLSLPDIEGFVHNWYRARIDNEPERRRHAGDLIRILHDETCRAIRDLAENPLLLTIICLVHRIDAVLPDERVVLYQKCTETLLNTWHAWKFKIEHQTSRNKVERRNRGRMEAIAHWMHGAMGDQEQGKRAVVPYEDLLEFLTDYIIEFEKPRFDAPEELAETFLRFVRERAGLLIEAGERQYSFVHLSFQEYLTATFLRKSGEAGGIGVVWEAVRDKVDQSRWQEVLRLLIGALDRTESQRFLLEAIRAEREPRGMVRRALLLGSCLLDGVDAAEEMEEEILEDWLYAATSIQDERDLGELVQQILTWLERPQDGKALLRAVIGRIGRPRGKRGLAPETALLLAILGWGPDEITALGLVDWRSETEAGLFTHVLTPSPFSQALPEDSLRFIHAASRAMALTNPTTNLGAVLFGALVQVPKSGACFPGLVDLLAAFHMDGPFPEYLRNTILLGLGLSPKRLSLTDASSGEAGIHRAVRWALAIDWYQDRALARARARDWALDLDRVRALDPKQGDLYEVAGVFVQQVFGEARIRDLLLDLFCDLLQLQPKTHWKLVLARCLLPYAGGSISLVDPEFWRATEAAIASGQPTPTQCENAACLLIFDIWLWLYGSYKSREQTLFPILAAQSRDIEHPALRIAHVLRDLAYGDQNRAKELKQMLQSRDPAYRRLFIDACWIDA